MKKSIVLGIVLALLTLLPAFSSGCNERPAPARESATVADTAKVAAKPNEVALKAYKKNVLATYYADKFNGRKTSSGERFDNKKYTAAHMKLPFGTMVRVTNEANGKFVDVKVNDRGPYSKKLEIDLTKKAFNEIATKGAGTVTVKIEIIEKPKK